MNWLYYLLESNLYLAVFYGFYRLCLHKETFYTLNRYYLITATLLSFTLPVCTVSMVIRLFSSPEVEILAVGPQQQNTDPHAWLLSVLSTALYILYFLVAIGFLVKMLMSLAGIFKVYFASDRKRIGNVIYVELDSQQSAFSFFNILFINPGVSQKNTVLKHEMIHITQRHSADILFFEFIQIISWFSPVVYLIKQDIKLLHEYIADDLTTASDVQKHDYALFLIENSFGVLPNKLSNQIFNQSLIKRRIKMLNKEKSGGLTKFRFLLLAPITMGLLSVSTLAFAKDYAVVDLLPEGNSVTLQDTTKARRLPPPPPVEPRPLRKKSKLAPPPPPVEPGAVKQVEVQVLKSKGGKTSYRVSPPPPPAEPGAAGQKIKQVEVPIVQPANNVKFPPPIVRKNKSKDQVKFPPPIVRKNKTKDQVKFPPPIVKKIKEPKVEVTRFDSKGQKLPPPPPVEPEKNTTTIKLEGSDKVIKVGGRNNKVSVDGVEYDYQSLEYSSSKAARLSKADVNHNRKLFLAKDAKVNIKAAPGNVISVQTP